MFDDKKVEVPDKKDSFENMIKELPWHVLKEIISSRTGLLKEYQKGGHRLSGKHRNRAITLISQNIHEIDSYTLFFKWYDEKTKYKEILDGYFISEEYEKWIKNKKLKEGEYALTDSRFETFYSALIRENALIFLHFSPIIFTAKQAKILIEMPEPTEKIEKKVNQSSIIPKESEETSFKDSKTEQKDLKVEVNKLTKKNKKMELKIAELESDSKKLREKNLRLKETINRYRDEIDMRIDEVESKNKEELDNMYEEKARAEWDAKNSKDNLKKANRQLEIRARQINNLNQKVSHLKTTEKARFHRILDKIDMKELIACLNEPKEVKELILAVVRPPISDEDDSSGKSNEDFKSFWLDLLEKESRILEKIDSINIDDINETFFEDWDTHTDDFNDLEYSLSARATLTRLLHEVLWQNRE